MDILEDTKVVTADGKKVGSVDRVVLNPRTHQVTHIVVRKGLILPEDKLIPIDLIDMTAGNELRLKPGAPDPKGFPPFEETEYIPLNTTEQARANYDNEMIPPIYNYPSYGIAPVWGGSGYFGPYTGQFPGGYMPATETNIPEGTAPLTEGMEVISADGSRAGSLKEVGINPETDYATHLVIAQGLFRGEKVIPTDWIDYVDEKGVHLTVGEEFIRGLPDK